MDRIKKLCSYLADCESFADVACDHGYIAQYVLKNGLCKNVVVSDISEKCLDKARKLLSDYINSGECRAVCCDGLDAIAEDTQCVVIAGLGGEEIIRILKGNFIPKAFLFQPMKNADKLRKFLIANECCLDTDDVFSDGAKYYFVIKGRYGEKQEYSDIQFEYGKDSLNNPVFYSYLKEELDKKRAYLTKNLSADNRLLLEKRIAEMEEVYNNGLKRST